MASDSSYKHSELTDAIIGVFYDVYNELGFGFLESVYRKALCMALIEKGLRVESEVATSVFFRGEKVGDFRADLIVNQIVLLELKTAEKIVRAHEAQVLNYLRSTTLEFRTHSELRSAAADSPASVGQCSKALASAA